MKDFFKDLLLYNDTFNRKYIDFCREHQEKISEKALLLLSHLINAQNIWNTRILGGNILGVWDVFPFEKLKKLNEKNLKTSLEILENEDLEKGIPYTNSKGEKFENKLKDIIFHYNNHCTYHRAQIATEIKNAGLEPPISDYIFYKR